jgi:SAM-dependent methyltransferase
MAATVTDEERYDRMLEPFGRAALDGARLAAGQRVLDVGCGAGATTVDAADRVAASGRAVGIDLSAEILGRARRRAAAHGSRAEFVHGDAGSHPFAPCSFDAVISRFGTMHFADPEAAFAHLAGLLVPGGRLSFVAWQAAERNAWASIPDAAVARHLPGEAPNLHRSAAGPFLLADPDRVRALLGSAGFGGVRLAGIEHAAWVGSDPEDVLGFFAREAGAAVRASAGADLLAKVAADLSQELARFATGDGVRLPAAAWLVTATTG